MFDTHCHLNFKRFHDVLDEVITHAKQAGVTKLVVPGTDMISSQRALQIASQYEGVYAAVGIHPHHAVETGPFDSKGQLKSVIGKIKTLLQYEKVVAIGEVGLDRHEYTNTKYNNYIVDERFMHSQKELLLEQLKLAKEYNKSVILHNREAKQELLSMLTDNRELITEYRCVFHCCEPDTDLFNFAKQHHVFIGVDGDVTYDKKKRDFIKEVPLHMLVLETDSPYLLPEPLRSQKQFPNEPKNIPIIGEYLSLLLDKTQEEIITQTTANAHRLFNLPENK